MTLAPEQGLEDLREVIRAYNELAGRLEDSQSSLQREVERLREELEEKNRQLARKNRLEVLGEMAAGVAHEIRNPLGGIELYAGLIARAPSEGERVTKYAHKIIGATRDLSRTVGEILDFTRPLRPQARPLRVDDVVEAALDLASARVDAAGVKVARTARPEAIVAGDRNLLQRAFLNVIHNAVDAMAGGGTLKVSVARARLGARAAWRVAFADTGAGIAEADLAKVFDPFFTRKEGGTGLGLAMTGRIVAAHEGRLAAANAEGGGAVFSFTLPADAGEGRG